LTLKGCFEHGTGIQANTGLCNHFLLVMKYFFAARDDLSDVLAAYTQHWEQSTAEDADLIVVLGGDGFMLTMLAQYVALGKPFYGIRFGSVGYMMQDAVPIPDLERAIQLTRMVAYTPLSVNFYSDEHTLHTYLAFNDVSIYRRHYQALKLKISIDNMVLCPLLMGDGIVCASRLGASAYYRSSGGLALQPEHAWGVNALHPSPEFFWRGMPLLPHHRLQIEILHGERRPAVLGWDGQDQDLPYSHHPVTIALAPECKVRIARNAA
jgi:NAD+ kinase